MKQDSDGKQQWHFYGKSLLRQQLSRWLLLAAKVCDQWYDLHRFPWGEPNVWGWDGLVGGKNQSKTMDSKRFIWFWEKVSLLRKMENSTMIVSPQLLEGDVCIIYSLSKWDWYYCQNTVKTLKTWSSHGRKKRDTSTPSSAFGSKTLSLNAVQELSYWSFRIVQQLHTFDKG